MTGEMVFFSILKIGIWIACGVIGAKLMKSKNRSEVIGVIMGLLLGLIGLIILLLIPKKKIEEDPTKKIIDVEPEIISEEDIEQTESN